MIFGATGDLMRQKVLPALYHLFTNEQLPSKFAVIGISNESFSDSSFRNLVKDSVEKHLGKDAGASDNFYRYFSYSRTSFENKQDYKKISSLLSKTGETFKTCSNKLFYLASPPQFFETIIKNLASSGLTKPCSKEAGFSRIIIEKPFGKDEKTARKLDELLGMSFKEEQIFRIDHYLAKEMVQNILAFRFSNNIFEQSFNNQYVERINVRLYEKAGVENRGAFYNKVGALRDVGQNHLLQMLAFMAMDAPASFSSNAVKQKRVQVFNNLRKPTLNDIKNNSFRAQYKSYQDVKGVNPGSKTETYFKVVAYLDSKRWQKVPMILESGKKLGTAIKEIVVHFKHPQPCLCAGNKHLRNKIQFKLEPKQSVNINLWLKEPGLKMEIVPRFFDLMANTGPFKEYAEEYETLLLDCITGNQFLFVSTDEIRAMWNFIDPIEAAWKENIVPLATYKPDSADITKQAKLLAEEQILRAA